MVLFLFFQVGFLLFVQKERIYKKIPEIPNPDFQWRTKKLLSNLRI